MKKSFMIYAVGHERGARMFFLAFLLLFSAVSFGFDLNSSHSKKYLTNTVSAATPTPDGRGDSFKMELDKNHFTVPCPPGYRCRQSDDSALFVVTVSAAERADSAVRFSYTVSDGRVIGEGAKVGWDLTGAMPGTYYITVAVADRTGKTVQTITKTVNVYKYEDDSHRCIECPTLQVNAPSSPIQAGETMTFTTNFSGGDDSVTYNWTISDGEIIEGQGTPVIKVATNPKMAGKSVKAAVKFKWICSEICNNTASASGSVVSGKRREK